MNTLQNLQSYSYYMFNYLGLGSHRLGCWLSNWLRCRFSCSFSGCSFGCWCWLL
ncbi:GSCOCG00006915001-RA-CDS [Cotesia congregata]|nr:GSCOCG00006915001-RA-CDS [Cotesia congregata]